MSDYEEDLFEDTVEDMPSYNNSKRNNARDNKPIEINNDLDDPDYDEDFEESNRNLAKGNLYKNPGSVTGKSTGYLGKGNLSKLPNKTGRSGTIKSIMSEDRASYATNAEKVLLQYADKHPLKAMEKSVMEARNTLDKMKSIEQTVETIDDEEQKMNYVDRQNKKLRSELKKMNNNLNKLIDYIKDLHLKSKPKAEDQKPVELILRARNEEVKNSDKQLMNLMNEHQRLQKRLDQVSDPTYMINLRKEIQDAEHKINVTLKKEKKQLEVEQFRREKKMDKIITYGEPENMKSINNAQKELEVVSERLSKLRAKKAKLAEFKQTQDQQMEVLKQRLEKVMKRAQDYGIDDDLKKEEAKLREDKETDLLVEKEKKRYKQLCEQKKKVNKELDDKINILKSKKKNMSDLIQRCKKYSDPQTREMLDKWEQQIQANAYTFEGNLEIEAPQVEQSSRVGSMRKSTSKSKHSSVRKKLPSVRSNTSEKHSDHEPTEDDLDDNPAEQSISSKHSSKSKISTQSIAKEASEHLSEHNSRQNEEIQSIHESQKSIKSIVNSNAENEEQKDSTSKPSFASKPFAKPSFASKPSFGRQGTGNSRAFSNQGSIHDNKPYEYEPKTNINIKPSEPVSFTEKYGLGSNKSDREPEALPRQRDDDSIKKYDTNSPKNDPEPAPRRRTFEDIMSNNSHQNSQNNSQIDAIGTIATNNSRRLRAKDPFENNQSYDPFSRFNN